MQHQVSILARPAGRALRQETLGTLGQLTAFQSSPGPRAGRCQAEGAPQPSGAGRFNPRPARGPGAAGSGATVQLPLGQFQSSPGPRAGRCCRAVGRLRTANLLFQSSPGPRAGRCRGEAVGFGAGHVNVSILARPAGRALPLDAVAHRRRLTRFNPRPARGPGAAGVVDGIEGVRQVVSILARPAGRALRQVHAGLLLLRPLVSILARPAGRALHVVYEPHPRRP